MCLYYETNRERFVVKNKNKITIEHTERFMKKIFSLALATIALCGIPAVAQTQKTTTCTTPTEQCKAAENCKPATCGKNPGHCDAFTGLNLTDAQKQSLTELRNNRRTAQQARKQEKQMAKKEDRRQNDSLRKTERREYLANVKNILTPEQYVVFLENIVVEQPMPGGRNHKMHADRGRRIQKDSRMERRTGEGLAKGQRPQRGTKINASMNTQQ